MIDRGADDGQPDAHVDSAIEGEQLHWDVALVVIHGDNNIEFAFDGAQKNRVAWQWVRNIIATRPCIGDSRYNFPRLFITKQAAFAGMRIKASHGNTRLGNAQGATGMIGQIDHFFHPLARHTADRLL